MDRTLMPTVAVLAAAGLMFEWSRIDLRFQDLWYDFHTHSWWLDRTSFWPRMICYHGCKGLVWAIGLAALACACFPRMIPAGARVRRVDLLVLATTLAAAPLLVATSKATTNVFTPAQVRRYGGFAPYVKPFERYPANDRPTARGRAFPAGHASGGFSLMALAGLAGSLRRRIAGVLAGLAVGSVMGFYQIANGNHYLSHTVYAGLICWIVFLLARRAWGAADPWMSEHPNSSSATEAVPS